jgi:uncharacterized membrane protein YhaH (DUF805 family)
MRIVWNPPPESGQLGFVGSVCLTFSRYADFRGRASRREYWYFVLFQFLLNVASIIADYSILNDSNLGEAVFYIAMVLPSITVTVRRLHDTERSGWWLLLLALPAIGFIVLMAWCAAPGQRRWNEYGPDPLAPGQSPQLGPGPG